MEKEQLEFEREQIRNTRKLNLIDSLDDLGLNDKQKIEFIKYYYTVLDEMNLLEALEEFKKK